VRGAPLNTTRLTTLAASLPWLIRYPAWRANELVRRITDRSGFSHLILIIANHFEPGYHEEFDQFGRQGTPHDLFIQLRRLDDWCEQARKIGRAVHDHDGTPFRHTNFYPAEQYYEPLLNRLAALQAAGLGEVEIHIHHGVDRPDTAENFRKVLVSFRDTIAHDHLCLSTFADDNTPRYAFVHGNWALANSARGRFCGVDSEMQILAETGCYADMTLPSAPDISQVARINAIYECGHPLNERKPHRSGPSLRVNKDPNLPIIFSGPLVLDWQRRKFGILPRLDNSALTCKYPLTLDRLNHWRRANISVLGKPNWVFIKLYCHGFFDYDQPVTIGEKMQSFLENVLELAERSRRFKLHFATAREAFNMVFSAVEGREGNPGDYRNYKLRQIMQQGPR
jgi:hypothetical protein